MKWLTLTTAPLVYAAALLLVAFLAPLRATSRDLIGLNVTVTVLYLIWLALALLPRLRGRRDLGAGRTDVAPAATPARRAGNDQRDIPVRAAPVRVRGRLRRAEGENLNESS